MACIFCVNFLCCGAEVEFELGDFDVGDEKPWPAVNPYLKIQNMAEAGLTQEKTSAILYMRPEAVQLWDCLLNESKYIFNISGPPGTGKSSVVWAWACWRARVHRKKIIWLHYSHCN